MAKFVLGISSSFCAGFIEGQAADLKTRGHDVVIISGPGPEISQLAHQEGATLYTIPFTRTLSPFQDLLHLRDIINILRREKPDVVNAGNPKSAFLILLAAYLMKIRLRIFTMHGLVSDHRTGWVRSVIVWSERTSCRFAHRVVIVSHQLQQHAIELGLVKPEQSVVLANGSCNGLQVERFRLTHPVRVAADRFLASQQIGEEDKVIGFVGRVNADKGIEVLFASMELIWQKWPQVRLLMVGPLEEGHGLSASIVHQIHEDPRIVFVGKQAEMPVMYAAMDLLVLPSFREGLPNVLLEAASMGLPMIASNISGCSDVIQHGVSGYLFPAGNHLALANLIEAFLENPADSLAMTLKAQQFVHESFSQTEMREALYDLYQARLAALK